ncbi:hypothetical protein C1A50_0766 [Paenibacillus polymyxa]|nr:hypothetical protein C1A50_0766 [Paenibacillus polymyxa]
MSFSAFSHHEKRFLQTISHGLKEPFCSKVSSKREHHYLGMDAT